MIAARVTGEDVMNWFKCIIIDKGRTAGVKEKMPVVTPAGVVGQAVEVSRWHTKVMIINDTNSAVDVYTTGKHTRGIVEGTGQTILKMKYVLKNDDIEVGDRLITSGKDAIYPAGLALGIVIKIDKTQAGTLFRISTSCLSTTSRSSTKSSWSRNNAKDRLPGLRRLSDGVRIFALLLPAH